MFVKLDTLLKGFSLGKLISKEKAEALVKNQIGIVGFNGCVVMPGFSLGIGVFPFNMTPIKVDDVILGEGPFLEYTLRDIVTMFGFWPNASSFQTLLDIQESIGDYTIDLDDMLSYLISESPQRHTIMRYESGCVCAFWFKYFIKKGAEPHDWMRVDDEVIL